MKKFVCAVVTGASSGLGKEFALTLGKHGCSRMLLVARRLERLETLAQELRSQDGEIQVEILPVDLSLDEGRLAITAKLVSLNWEPDLLINNAGLGDYGTLDSADWQRVDLVLQTNITALTHLCQLLSPGMIERGRGAILNVSSIASFLPLPSFAVYAASKAYVTSFSEALRQELHPHGVRVHTLCPGPVPTEFGAVAEREAGGPRWHQPKALQLSAERVVREGLHSVQIDRPLLIPGWLLWFGMTMLGALPRPVRRWMIGLSYRVQFSKANHPA
ncbi:MAG: SDR family NAD(P)-dependent oxidoreductase [Verrucomicrobiales bacterium]